MTTTMIKTTGLTITAAACLGMPAVSLKSAVSLPEFGFAAGFGFGAGLDAVLGGGSDLPLVGNGLGNGLGAIRDERPMSASVAAAAVEDGHVYAAGAGNHRSAKQQSEQQHTMWAFRGPGPWKERT